ncbi:4a-hydroxytetrahydrobiopterin dehydratase [Paeniglutamicibacter terrestris]|uniref:Putative pterin-4-alpha-carbinolamine dehydratase n=1 Tax=Paeniglutamicibacter terrestris TaxID=2723403 RepID=A0ABX1G492_9MICC|nr:4a-hydroxytetrahydrobiopterin dehydratase [Paeniglutamicibacter terrestris]NKG20405.1 4a-hydroxytetrahydrobiopterin dehydratase [Paeniglutamicibacter terrestris]
MSLEKDSPTRVLTDYEIARALKELPSWRQRSGSLVCAWSFADSREAIDFLAIVAEAAERQGHHPDVDWRWNTIFLSLTSHDVGSEITLRDLALATLLEFAAADCGAVAVPQRHQDVELVIQSADPGALEQFWIDALGYRVGRDGVLRDPQGRNPQLRFNTPTDKNAAGIVVEKYVSATSQEQDHDQEPTERPGPGFLLDAEGNRFALRTDEQLDPPPFQ